MDDNFLDNIFPMFSGDMMDDIDGEENKKTFLDKYTTDLTKAFRGKKKNKVIGRDKEIARVIEVLCRKTKNNPVLVGESGVGKTSIVECLAQAIVKQNVPNVLLKKKILSLNINSLVAGSIYRGEFEGRVEKLLNEIKADKNIILFIDELHTLIGAGNPKGELDAAEIFKTPLSNGDIQIIGATTTKEYSQHIENLPALSRRFQKIDIAEPSDDDTIEILQGVKGQYENYHHVIYNEDVIPSIVKLSRRYLTEQYFPDKAIDLLDEAGAKVNIEKVDSSTQLEKLRVKLTILKGDKDEAVKNQDFESAAALRDKIAKLNEKIAALQLKSKSDTKVTYCVTSSDVAKVVARMTGIPLDDLDLTETDRLLNMEAELHKSIVSQDAAIRAISSAVRRNKVGISSGKRPLGSFIFLGPTGVGKTALAKTLAKFIFGKEDALLRIDMSDYIESASITRLVGAAPGYVGYEEGGILTTYVRQHPYSIILLDEIEKANQSIFNLLLQMLEEGQLSDKLGHVVNFRNTIVIMTSNAGSRAITNEGKVGFGTASGVMSHNEIKANALNELKKLMNPEIINRIDEIVVFDPLSKDDISNILDIQLGELIARLKERGYDLSFTDSAKEYLAKKGYDPAMGARPMRRLIQREVEDPLSLMILDKRNRDKNTISVDYCVGDGAYNKEGKICVKLFEKAKVVMLDRDTKGVTMGIRRKGLSEHKKMADI